MILRLSVPLLLLGALVSASACSSDEPAVDGKNDKTDGGKGDGSTPQSDAGAVQAKRVVCPTPIAAAPSGQLCTVTAGSADKLMIQATVLAGDTVYENGAVVVDRSGPNGTISCAGCDCEPAGATVLACAAGVLSPGLINSHDHMPFNASSGPKGHGSERYNHRHDWRKGLRGHTKIGTDRSAEDDAAKQFAEMRMLISGVTSLVGSGSATNLVRNLDDASADGNLGAGKVDYSTFPLGDGSAGTLNASGCKYGKIETDSVLKSRIYLPHVSEGIDAEARNEYACLTGQGEGSVNTIASNTSIVHGIGLTAADIADIAAKGAKLVWSPRTNIDLYGQTADVLTFRRAGVNIALGTDWILSGSMNMLRELKCADSLNKNQYANSFSDYEIWNMATANGAVAMGVEDRLGLIKAGYIADLALYDGSTNKDFRAVIDAEISDVGLVMRGGAPLFGDSAILDGLVSGADADKCETLVTCERDKKLCAELDTGNTLAAMKSAAKPIYELFYCGTPDDEPSCVPARPDEYSGVASATDQDGDGIDDSVDNCSSIFNPKRPLDSNEQPNYDKDEAGDSCDVCPLNAGTTCASVDPNDSDGDGKPNASDNCPTLANADQADADGDGIGIGDACDKCPNEANAAGAVCTASISDIKQGIGWSVSDVVRIKGAVVIASGDTGVFLQTEAGGDYSGIFAFSGKATGNPAVGDVIDLTATLVDFGGALELKNWTDLVTVSTGHAVPAPTLVTAADLAPTSELAKKLEGTLVKIVEVTAGATSAQFGTTDLNDGTFQLAKLLYAYPPPPAGTPLDLVQGALSFGFEHYRVCPRAAADVIVDPAAPRLVASIAPSTIIVPPGGTKSVTINLNLPAAPGGMVVTLGVAPAGVVSLPASVTIAENESSATVLLTAVAASGAATLSANVAGQPPITAPLSVQVPPVECLIISEYSEGAGQNKAIEIFNCGGSIDTQGFLLCQTNRNGTNVVGNTQSLPLSSVLEAGAVRTFCNNGNAYGATLACDVTSGSVVGFNGNDSIYIVRDVNNNATCDATDTVLDAFGHIAGQTSNATAWAEQTFSRCDLTPYDGSGSTFDPLTKFKVVPDVSGFGTAPPAGVCN